MQECLGVQRLPGDENSSLSGVDPENEVQLYWVSLGGNLLRCNWCLDNGGTEICNLPDGSQLANSI